VLQCRLLRFHAQPHAQPGISKPGISKLTCKPIFKL
jgi:hypothetical protein